MKNEIKGYWEENPCGAISAKEKYSKEWFDEIEDYRYTHEPEIHAFAQFTRWAGKSVFEFGSGMGTDGKQFQRAGADYDGHDLTFASTLACHKRGLNMVLEPEYIKKKYDLVYSWGVIHHTPDPEAVLRLLYGLLKQGGTIKVMVYNRHSVFAILKFLKYFPKAWTLKSLIWNYQESPGTKAYTMNEAKELFAKVGFKDLKISARPSIYDIRPEANLFVRSIAYLLTFLLGYNSGWFMWIEGRK